MGRLPALLWLAIVILAAGYLGHRLNAGLGFRTDLMALLPREEQDPVLQRANDAVTRALGKRVVALVGHADRLTARKAAIKLTADLIATGLFAQVGEGLDADRMRRLGTLYFPYRNGLLSDGDRALLTAGRGEDIAVRALSQAFGFVGMADAGLLRRDPFLLMPAFFAGLPLPLSRLSPDDGLLSLTEQGTTWILVSATLVGEPLELDVQDRLVAAFDASVGTMPDIQVKRLGAVFFAHAGSQTALQETSTLGLVSLIGTMLLIVLVFRRLGPLLHNLLALAVGVGTGLSGSLALFGELHVATLLFGTSLIGVAVDYGLHYSATLFDPSAGSPRERMSHVLPGIALGLVTTLIGYAALALAPFPGLRQIAVFSVLGLVAAFLTVMLWLPALDRSRPIRHGAGMMAAAAGLWALWDQSRYRRLRAIVLVTIAGLGIVGLAYLRVDDDVHRLQAPSTALQREQEDIQRLIGASTASQFLLVQAASDEEALRREEDLAPVLSQLIPQGVVTGSLSPAAFVPSAARQRQNRSLVASALETPFLAAQLRQLGLASAEPINQDGVLTVEQAIGADGTPFLRDLVLAPGIHVVALQGLTDPARVQAAVADLPGVRLVDPTADFSDLLAKYRGRALMLTGLSALIIAAVLFWRYGLKGTLWVMAPSVVGLLLAPAMVGLAGHSFNFFHAMALILVLSIGVDYGVFCAESGADKRPVTMFAVWLASLTTLLSFGLLAGSQVVGVRSFGEIMLVGIVLSFLFAPLAGRGAPSAVEPLRRTAPERGSRAP